VGRDRKGTAGTAATAATAGTTATIGYVSLEHTRTQHNCSTTINKFYHFEGVARLRRRRSLVALKGGY
jgi:hypothetical protein